MGVLREIARSVCRVPHRTLRHVLHAHAELPTPQCPSTAHGACQGVRARLRPVDPGGVGFDWGSPAEHVGAWVGRNCVVDGVFERLVMA